MDNGFSNELYNFIELRLYKKGASLSLRNIFLPSSMHWNLLLSELPSFVMSEIDLWRPILVFKQVVLFPTKGLKKVNALVEELQHHLVYESI